MAALDAYEAGVCSGCGFHHSLADDLANTFTFENRVCKTCQGWARYGRVQDAADKKLRDAQGETLPPATPDPADGRKTFMRLLSSEEGQQLRARRSSRSPAPVPPAPKR